MFKITESVKMQLKKQKNFSGILDRKFREKALEFIRSNAGANTEDIDQHLNCSQSERSQTLGDLKQHGLIRDEAQKGGFKVYFANESVIEQKFDFDQKSKAEIQFEAVSAFWLACFHVKIEGLIERVFDQDINRLQSLFKASDYSIFDFLGVITQAEKKIFVQYILNIKK